MGVSCIVESQIKAFLMNGIMLFHVIFKMKEYFTF